MIAFIKSQACKRGAGEGITGVNKKCVTASAATREPDLTELWIVLRFYLNLFFFVRKDLNLRTGFDLRILSMFQKTKRTE